MDIVDKKTRSRMMAGIRGKNTEMEVEAKRLFRKNGVRFRAHPKLYGNPDFYIPERRLVLFLDGCFWHKCPRHFKWPATNVSFWKKKIISNVKRDRLVTKILKSRGYKVRRIYECRFWHMTNEVVSVPIFSGS